MLKNPDTMKTYRVFAILAMALLLCAPCASGQSFKDGLKQIGKRIGKQVERRVEQRVVNEATKQVDKQVDNVFDAVSGKNSDKKSDRSSDKKTERQTEQTTVTKPAARTSEKKSATRQAAGKSARDRQLEQQYEAMLGPDAGKEEETPVTPGVKLPKEHTALFAPLGYDVDAKWGRQSIKPVLPPTGAAKQVDWVDKMPNLFNLDNESLVEEFLLLDQCKEDGYIENLTPADHRYYSTKDELLARTEQLNGLAKYCKEIMDEYASEDPDWVIEHAENQLVNLIGSGAYKRLLRSSIAPIFEKASRFIDDETRAYFAAHGGYENAVNKNLTVWDPHPDKKGITTSVQGQSGFVVDEVGAGATVDIDGVQYVLHNSGRGKGGWSFITSVAKTAIAGKDIVIPDYIYYNGGKYAVKSMRGGLFSGTTIKSVKLPNTLTEISNAVFRDTPITEIVIPASVKSLQGSVFQGCTKLAKVTFEGDYMEEFSGSFQNCTSLRSVVCPRRVDRISYDMFTGCSNLTEVVLPENLTEIPSSMFDGCKKLTKIDVPHTVTKVGMSAFANCGVTELDLRNVTEFEAFCFNGCKALKKVILSSTLKDNFLTETYTEFMECPLLQVKWENNQYIIPAGFVFVP